MEETRGRRKTRVGKVVSDKMDKTIVVAIADNKKHPLYNKVVKTTYTQYNSNDSTNQFNWGAFVANQPESVLKALGIFDMM
jgi:small subunit ribosomal protein S17